MSKIVVGNFKMNMTLQDVAQYVQYINNINFNPNQNEIILCPSYIYIPYLNNNINFKVGAQDVSANHMGSYTGEISAMQLKSENVKYSILGHSERRMNFRETENIINKKIRQCVDNNIKPIVCIGESKEERLMMKTEQILRRSILDLFRGFTKEQLSDIIVAYEPIWAIGSGITPTPKEIEETAYYIKDLVRSAYKVDIRVLYGGSINLSDMHKFIGLNNIDGYLIGGASIDVEEFSKIVELIS